MHLANNTLLPHELWAATTMAAWRAALDMTSSFATASASLMAATPAAPQSTARPEFAERRAAAGSRSWYRAPYRSPFDPFFWMSPGHPVDHMGDWINLLRHASSAVPGFPAAFTTPAPQAAMASAPFLFPWLTMAEQMGFGLRPSVGSTGDNIVDFASAYANYRTAGGHASAQITRSGMGDIGGARPTGETASSWPFPMAFFLPIWLR